MMPAKPIGYDLSAMIRSRSKLAPCAAQKSADVFQLKNFVVYQINPSA